MKRSTSRTAAWTPLALVSAISTLTIAPAAAQQDADRALAPVVVTASRVAQPQTDAISHTTVITADDIRKLPAVDLPALLQREAGIQITRNGGPGSTTGLFMRGAETRQTLVLIDGIPMTKQDATGTVSIEQIMPDQIDRVEIVRGNVSAIYGSGAVGGVIQIFTKTGKGPAQFSASGEAGARDTRRLAAGVSGQTGSLSYALNLSKFKTDGFSALNPAQNPNANPDDDGYDNESASGYLGYQITPDNAIGARFLASRGDTEYDSNFAAPSDIHTQTIRTNMVSMFSKNRLTAAWQSDVTVARFTDKYENLDAGFASWFNTKTEQVRWDNSYQLADKWLATAGIEHRQESVLTIFDLDEDRKVTGVYGGVLGHIDRHQLQANLRHDDHSDVSAATTGYLGYGYQLTESVKATASYSTAFSAAPLGYLFSPVFGNPGLDPERTKTAELGVQYATGNNLLKAIVFQSRTKDQIVFGTTRFENIARVRNEGLELSYAGQLHGLNLRSSLTLQEPRDETTDRIVTRRARTLASIGVSKSFDKLTLGGDLQYTGKRKDGTRDLAAYEVLNLHARYQINKGWAAYARVENLLDEEYQTAYGYNQAPRGVFVGVNWQH